MELQHVNLKIFADDHTAVDATACIGLFHDWIRQNALDELLIDVADYRHVQQGPSVILIGLQADYCIDNTGGRYGLRYNRKAACEGTNQDRFRQALTSAARACRMIETQLDGNPAPRFSGQSLELLINDRALAPNTPETHSACRPEFETFLDSLYGAGQYELEAHDEPRSRFGFTVRGGGPLDLDTLISEAN